LLFVQDKVVFVFPKNKQIFWFLFLFISWFFI
jgi:hypothetical protein